VSDRIWSGVQKCRVLVVDRIYFIFKSQMILTLCVVYPALVSSELLNHRLLLDLTTKVSYSAELGCGLKIYISSKFPGGAEPLSKNH
jgi:hypothetical protein